MYVDIYQAISDNPFLGFAAPPFGIWDMFMMNVRGVLTSGSAYFFGGF